MAKNIFALDKIKNSTNLSLATRLTLRPIVPPAVEEDIEDVIEEEEEVIVEPVVVFSSQELDLSPTQLNHRKARIDWRGQSFNDEILLPYDTYEDVELTNLSYAYIPDYNNLNTWRTAGAPISNTPPDYIDSVELDQVNKVLRVTINDSIVFGELTILVYSDGIINPNNSGIPEFENAASFGINFFTNEVHHETTIYTVTALKYTRGTGDFTAEIDLPFLYQSDDLWVPGDAPQLEEYALDDYLQLFELFTPDFFHSVQPYLGETFLNLGPGVFISLGSDRTVSNFTVQTGHSGLIPSGEFMHEIRFTGLGVFDGGYFFSYPPADCAVIVKMEDT